MTAATVLRPLAAFLRTWASLPLVGWAGKADNVIVFDVYCPGHGSRVLLFTDNVLALFNRADGPYLRWRCFCGETGVRRFVRSSYPQRREATGDAFTCGKARSTDGSGVS